MVFSILSGLFGCGGKAAATVTSVEEMTLTLRGMRGGTVYKFEGEALCRYRELYRDGKDELIPEKAVPCSMQTMVGLANACGILRWDGFHGAHPKNVQDGIMFRFAATVNGGQTIAADGSANFPKGYYDFVRALDEMLST